mgnify:CR=1 FL=1
MNETNTEQQEEETQLLFPIIVERLLRKTASSRIFCWVTGTLGLDLVWLGAHFYVVPK